ncbi:uncharacterized protein L201_006884 [Kwoniella dendrophila CBS 6074]|uniref:Ornithine decarboxylase antizyme n=1 Tax=Kwoniella dendrophila CBS 6074 TaxID=1295534 RepID=A0AAX4K503_9TREE
MSLPTRSININRNLRPAGALGNAGTGATTTSPSTSPLLFSSDYHHHDIDNPYSPPLAIARAGGQGGQIYVYSEDNNNSWGENQSYASFAGGGRQWRESSENTRESLMSYLHDPISQSSLSPSSSISSSPQTRSNIPINPFTPPSSFTQSVDIPQQNTSTTHHQQNNLSYSLPLTPISASSMSDNDSSSSPTQPAKPTTITVQAKKLTNKTVLPTKQERQIISLIASIFPKHFQSISNLSTTLEIVTPPSNVLKGFILDHHVNRTVFIHLLPPSASTNRFQERPEKLSPNFSQVLRPHDPLLSISPCSLSPTLSNSINSINHNISDRYGLDIRESLTALLDLSCDALEANNLILILDRNENAQDEQDQEYLRDTLHSLMYTGGQVLKSPCKSLLNDWEWDITKWVLVGMEL